MATVLEFNDATVVRNGRPILDHVTWSVDETERWAVLGPNGAGKSTLLSLASATQHPTTGEVDVLGERLGRTNVFELRPRIGVASSAMARRIPGDESVINVALTASYAVTGRWNEAYEEIDERRAQRVLEEWNLGDFAERDFGTLSDGEQKRTLIARAIMTDPELLLLDEPSASLDLGARENLLAALSSFAQSPYAPAIVMVTHHVEEIPVGITHVLLLREGKLVAAGPITEVLTSANLETTFGLPLHVTNAGGRYAARASH
ncbi:iron complex transport system ATP-binding protein [Pseudoclavibacter sp. JAI123]|uniref:ABC transporter ATP-binding protein n=1 Tax=Pseudoclavibacter sp. JAI123 TaxID=2723065 RepID=UPI0015CE8511|nr:ABC transporter ATP-binding protein [Pseudoclavibacter sp. JAI123]NYF13740.1 iron complex transport system ATP-binding protein [Pseudoclavibacter sp. JAI123]